MSRCLFFILLSINCNHLCAQQFEVLQTQKNTTTIHIPQQEMLFLSEMSKNTLYKVHSKTTTGYKLQSQLKSLSGKLNLFGQEQVFNSNDTSTLNIDGGIIIKNLLNNTKEITIKNNQIDVEETDSTDFVFSLINEDVSKYLLTIPTEKVRLGFNWSDSLITGQSKMVSEYFVSKLTNSAFEITEFISIKKTSIFRQNNQIVKQDLKGYSTSIRWYNLTTQILQNDETITKLIGTIESGVTIHPITIEAKTSSFVKQLL